MTALPLAKLASQSLVKKGFPDHLFQCLRSVQPHRRWRVTCGGCGIQVWDSAYFCRL